MSRHPLGRTAITAKLWNGEINVAAADGELCIISSVIDSVLLLYTIISLGYHRSGFDLEKNAEEGILYSTFKILWLGGDRTVLVM
jgi:hypothetical protein